jgi:RNA polymerase sigma-70 factor (ECF subfamily)
VGRLVEAFEAACRTLGREPPGGDLQRLETALARLCERARGAHPSFAIEDEAFMAHLARCGAPLDGPVDDIHAEDLFLICACLAGDSGALKALRQTHHRRLPGYLHKFGTDASYVEEVEVRLWDTLLIGSDGVPRLATYAGTGALDRWIGVAAQRIAMMMMRHEDVAARVHDEIAAADRLIQLDPEIAAIKEHYRETVQQAVEMAIAQLDAREKAIYRMHFVDGLTLQRIGKAYGVHHTTVLRWLEAARERVFKQAKVRLRAELKIGSDEFESLVQLLISRLDVDISQALSSRKGRTG